MRHPIITICLVVMASAACACGAELLVPSQFPTIQLAVNAAAPSDTVILADGTYTGPGNTNVTISKAITVRSQHGPENCIIDCNNTIGFLTKAGTLAGLTITKGRGAFCCNEGKFTLTNCILTRNEGAVFCVSGNLKIFNCSLSNNTPYITNVGGGKPPYNGCGGAIYCDNGSVLIVNSNISGNSALAGGGILCVENSSMTIKNSVISDNNATDSSPLKGGGGIFCEQSSMVIIGSEISRNSSHFGAGIYCNDATSLLISDCNIHHNVSEDLHSGPTSGGGIYCKAITQSINNTSFSIFNTSITDNVVKGMDCKGGGIYYEIPFSTSPTIPSRYNFILSGCIIARNSTSLIAHQKINNGGGLYCKGTVQMTETEVLNNSSVWGGGIYNAGPGLNISRCRISGNYTRFLGEALFSNIGEIVLESCVITDNRGPEGYTIWCEQTAILKMANCTIVGSNPPAISVTSSTSLPSSSITNSIIYDNCENKPYCNGQISGNNIFVSYSDVQGGYTGIGNIDTDPCFVKAGYLDTNGTPKTIDDFWVEGDYRLTAVSPCVDTGGVAFLMDNKDLAGNPRITGAALDMGAYEYQNSSPTAEAGPEQVAYAWIDGIASVTLDGSASRDADGDELSYLWSWSIDGNNFEANGVNPTIELPVGQHVISLIVNDGFEDSQPDDVNITVVGPVEVEVDITPDVLNLKSKGQWITCKITLPKGYIAKDVNTESILLQEQIEPEWVLAFGCSRIIFAKFDRSQVQAIIGNGEVELTISGLFKDGTPFEGSDEITVIGSNHPNKPRFRPKYRCFGYYQFNHQIWKGD